MKKFRREIQPKKIRFYHCGEYGDLYRRPHYHALIFGHDFPDKKWHMKRGDNNLYTSDTLSSYWGKGYCSIGDVTLESAGYVARYVMKKINGPQAQTLDPETGLRHYETITQDHEIIDLQPEYTTMSNRPGIGHDWYQEHKNETFPSDTVIVKRRPQQPPSYYANLYQAENPEGYAILKEKRISAIARSPDQTLERLKVRETVKLAQIQNLSRTLPERST